MRRISGLIIILFLLSTLFWSCGNDPDVIAKVDRYPIKVQEFREMAKQMFGTTNLKKISYPDRMKIMDRLISERLEAAQARELGFDKDPEYLKNIRNRRERIIAQRLFRKMVVRKLATEELSRQFFDWSNHRVDLVAVFIAYKGSRGSKATRTKEEAYKFALEVKEKLKKASDPTEVALRYSDRPTVQQNKGIYNNFPLGNYNLEVDRGVFSANKGDVVGPFDTITGYMVAKIINKKKLPVSRPFEDEREGIESRVYQFYFTKEGQKLYRKITNDLRKKYKAQVFKENIDKFIENVKEWAKKEDRKDSDFTEKERALILAKVEDKSITVGDFLNEFNGRFSQYYQRYTNPEILTKVIKGRIDFMAWVIEAKTRKIDKEPKMQLVIEKYAVSLLNDLWDKKLVQEKVQVSDEEIQKYYEENQAEFVEPRKIRVWEIAVRDEQKAKEIAKRARRGEDFQRLAKKFTEKSEMRSKGGDLGYIKEKTKPNLMEQKVFEAGPNKIIGPFRFGPYYTILKTGDIIPAQQKSLEKVRKIVVSRVRREKENQLRKKMRSELKKKYMYRINDSLLRRLT